MLKKIIKNLGQIHLMMKYFEVKIKTGWDRDGGPQLMTDWEG